MESDRGFAPSARRAAGPVIAAAALAAMAAACGSPGSSGSSSAGPAASSAAPGMTTATPRTTATKLTGAAATALIATALDNTRSVASVRVIGQGVPTGTAGEQVSFDLTLVSTAGCRGTVSLSNDQRFQIVATGGYVWVKPSASFYASLKLSKETLALLKDKYIKVKSTDKRLGQFASFCTFSGLFGSIPKPAGTAYVATPGTYQGQPAYKLTQTGKPGYAYISGTGKPLLLKLADQSAGGGTITFSEYGAAHTITAPSSAESVDGSQLGI